MSDLREFFKNAYAKKIEKEAIANKERNRAHAQKTIESFESLCGVKLDISQLDPETLAIDLGQGSQLRLTFDYAWQLLGECEICGKQLWSRKLYRAEEIGLLLVDFTPDWDHFCPQQSQPEPDIISALKHLIDDHLADR